MSSPDSEELLSNISDTSFVILGPNSLTHQENDDLQENFNLESSVNIKSEDGGLDFNKSVSDSSKYFSKSTSSEENIQEKLNELVKENYHLKETLSQNNLSIKLQLDTFLMWQQQVLKTHELHKQKFSETKDLILKLRMENLSLKKQLEESLQEFSVISVSDPSAQVDKKPDNSDVLKERIKEFENICNELTSKNENLEIEKQKLAQELADVKKQFSIQKNQLEEVTVENLFLKQKAENFPKNSSETNTYKSLPNAEARAQISNLFRQLDEEKGKVLKLKEALRKTKLSNGEASNSQEGIADEFAHCMDKFNDMNQLLDLRNQRMSDLSSWVALAEGNLRKNQKDEEVDCNLMSDLKEFKSYLDLEENVFKEKQESVDELKKQFTKLLEDYKSLQQQLNSLHSENQSIEKCKEEIDSLSAELQTKDKDLTSKQQECNELKEEIKKLNSEWEEKVSILQIQAELYRSDFNIERELREQLIGEKEGILEQVRLLESRVEELEKSTGGVSIVSKRSNAASPQKESGYVCPHCFLSFPDMTILQRHVDDCLDVFT